MDQQRSAPKPPLTLELIEKVVSELIAETFPISATHVRNQPSDCELKLNYSISQSPHNPDPSENVIEKICLYFFLSPRTNIAKTEIIISHTRSQAWTIMSEIPATSSKEFTIDLKSSINQYSNKKLNRVYSLGSIYNSQPNLAGLSHSNFSQQLTGQDLESSYFAIYPGGVCFDWNANENILTVISDRRLNKMNMVSQNKIVRKEDIKKFEQQHQDTNNPNDLDVIFGDEWSDQIHEIPASDIWSKEIDSKFLEFVMKKKEDIPEESGSSTVQANLGRASLKVDCDFKPLLNVSKGTIRDANL
jgi:hypothetical protein